MKRGFTVVEVLTAVAIVGMSITLFYSIFFLNWASFEKQLSLIDLQMEADKIIEMISFDCRRAKQVTLRPDGKYVEFDFLDPAVNPYVTYELTGSGIKRGVDGGGEGDISQNVDTKKSSFVLSGNCLIVTLVLVDNVFKRGMTLEVETRILARNSL